MHELLRQIESIVGCRDRESLAPQMLRAVRKLVAGSQAAILEASSVPGQQQYSAYAALTADGVQVFPDGMAPTGFRLAAPEPLLARLAETGEAVLSEHDDGFHCLFPLRAARASRRPGCLAVSAPRQPTGPEIEALSWLVRIYNNYLGMLDYSEFDSLTRLLNRKTFDETFERLIRRAHPLNPETTTERRQTSGEVWWLAVVDIDHFKRINDTTGHLFGDEVLLRFANLMRDSFRSYDLLFRFGGEEFVVMLQTFSQGGAEIALERFRHAVEAHEFPQVGQVTCSIGYTAVDPLRAPTDTLGQADAALYWCKANGRNRIAAYDDLVATGKLQPIRAASISPGIDIDTLFS